MKIIFIFLTFMLSAIAALSQSDSACINFNYLDKDLSLISELSDIQYIGISCTDTNMHGKKFLLSFDEYLNGKKIMEDTSQLICKVEKIPFIMGKDTVYEIFDLCSRMKFHNDDSIFKIRFAGRLLKDTFKLIMDYGGVKLYKLFTGDEKYSLRLISCATGNETKIKLNQLTPLLAYTPPFETTGGAASYCILGMEKIDDWFTKFKVKHYYVVNIKIE